MKRVEKLSSTAEQAQHVSSTTIMYRLLLSNTANWLSHWSRSLVFKLGNKMFIKQWSHPSLMKCSKATARPFLRTYLSQSRRTKRGWTADSLFRYGQTGSGYVRWCLPEYRCLCFMLRPIEAKLTRCSASSPWINYRKTQSLVTCPFWSPTLASCHAPYITSSKDFNVKWVGPSHLSGVTASDCLVVRRLHCENHLSGVVQRRINGFARRYYQWTAGKDQNLRGQR